MIVEQLIMLKMSMTKHCEIYTKDSNVVNYTES